MGYGYGMATRWGCSGYRAMGAMGLGCCSVPKAPPGVTHGAPQPLLCPLFTWGGHPPTPRYHEINLDPKNKGCPPPHTWKHCCLQWGTHRMGPQRGSPTLGCDAMVGMWGHSHLWDRPQLWGVTWGCPQLWGLTPSGGHRDAPALRCDTVGVSPTLRCDTVTRCPHFPWEVLKLLTVSPTLTQCPQGGPFIPS